MTGTICGLTFCPTSEKRLSAPLKSVTVHADVRGWTVGVTAELAYQNTLPEPIECQFVFPLTDNSAVYRLEADVAGKKLYAECRARKEAEEMYKDAVDSGHTGVLLENQSGSPDIFRIMLGNLPANQEAKVTIGFVQPAERDHDGTISFTLPTVLNPRYVPHDMLGDPEKMKEQFHFSVPYVAVSEVSYSMTFDAKICLGVNSKIAEIKPANETKDTIKVSFENGEKVSATVTLDGKFEQDHDFGLRIVPVNPFKPMVFIEPGLTAGTKKNWFESLASKKTELPWLSYAIACAWFEPESGKKVGTGIPGDEYWFVVDRSGSMGGNKIEDAKTALILFVKSLPVTCKFNIIGFGSSFACLFHDGSVSYKEETVEKALAHAKVIDADMGGTEILEPLKFIYSKPKSKAPGAKQYIILLTDGDVGNTEKVINLARNNAKTSRVFSIGIGPGASSALVNGLARVTGGLSEFVRNNQDRLQAKVISLLKATTDPLIEDISLTWDVSGGKLRTKMPDQVSTTVYQNHPLLQYALLEREGVDLTGYARLKGAIGNTSLDDKLNFYVAASVVTAADDVMPLHRLAAKARLMELQDLSATSDKDLKAEIVAISTATGILCNETAFVAVDHETKQPSKDENGRPLHFISIERPSTYYNPGVPFTNTANSKCDAAVVDKKVKPRLISFGRKYEEVNPADAARSAPQLDEVLVDGNSQAAPFVDNMELLVCGQKLNGSWTMSNDLAKATGSTKASNESFLRREVTAIVSLGGLDDIIVATLIGLAILRRRFARRHDEWELIEQKAVGYLRLQSSEFAGKVDELVEAIAKALTMSS